MFLPVDWLKEYIDTGVSSEETAELMTSIGLEVEGVHNTPEGEVIEIELTPNRGDCASVLGVARELSAKLKKPLKIQERVLVEEGEQIEEEYSISVEAPDFSPAYHLRLIRGVKVTDSPDWLKKRLIAAGQRPLNSIVDITNYLMLELGQPLHAFDADKINGKNLTVRAGLKEEKFIALDGRELILSENDTVISGGGEPLALGGVVGGLDSGVTSDTRNILLESAYFTPRIIAATERRVGVKTEASYRFSRGTDPKAAVKALERAALMILELSGGKIAPGTLSVEAASLDKPIIPVEVGFINGLLGTGFKGVEVKDILEPLGFGVEIEGESSLIIEIPSFRGDVDRPSDIAEEVARAYGYDNIPPSLPVSPIEEKLLRDADPFRKGGETLCSLGFSQAVTLTLTSSEAALKAGFNERDLVYLDNPISVNMDILRPSALFGLLEAAVYNINQGRKDIYIFERGPVFSKRGDNFCETEEIAFLFSSEDFFSAKRVILSVLKSLRQKYMIEYPSGSSLFDSKASGIIKIEGAPAGRFGVLSGDFLKSVPGSRRVFSGGYLSVNELDNELSLRRKYSPWSPYPSVFRDISIVVDASLTHSDIYGKIFSVGGAFLKKIRLFDIFRNEKIGKGKKSMSYELEFNSDNETLRSEQIDIRMDIILDTLKKSFAASLREE